MRDHQGGYVDGPCGAHPGSKVGWRRTGKRYSGRIYQRIGTFDGSREKKHGALIVPMVVTLEAENYK